MFGQPRLVPLPQLVPRRSIYFHPCLNLIIVFVYRDKWIPPEIRLRDRLCGTCVCFRPRPRAPKRVKDRNGFIAELRPRATRSLIRGWLSTAAEAGGLGGCIVALKRHASTVGRARCVVRSGCLLNWVEQFSDSVREEATSTAADRSVRPTPELIKMATLLYTPSTPMLTFNSQIKTIENKRQELSR